MSDYRVDLDIRSPEGGAVRDDLLKRTVVYECDDREEAERFVEYLKALAYEFEREEDGE